MTKDKSKASEPMDPSVKEVAEAAPHRNHERTCHAIKTLVEETHTLFPETPVEYSNYDGRNTALDVSFDLTVLDDTDTATFITLLGLVDSDPRVAKVVHEDGSLLVSMVSSPRTQDLRDPFGLADALDVLAEPVSLGYDLAFYHGGSL